MKKWIELSFIGLGLAVALFNVGCGVKGDPVPPESPEEIGRGRPNLERRIKSEDQNKNGDKVEVKN